MEIDGKKVKKVYQGINGKGVLQYDSSWENMRDNIKSRARKAADEIMDKVFVPGETVNSERLTNLIARHFAEGEE